jgi:hypothetical protein
MRLPVDTKLNEQIAINYGNKLLLSTTVSTTLFCLGMSAPYILASLFRSYRLTLASTGQILNAIGMIFILLFVDLLMFKSWDDKELQHAIKYYSRGRVLGILLAASIVAMSLLYTHS